MEGYVYIDPPVPTNDVLKRMARRSRRICEDLAGEGRGGAPNQRSPEDRRDSPCEAERATSAKAIAAYVSLAEPLEALVPERARPWWRRPVG